MTELSDLVSDQAVPVRERRWTTDKMALALRGLILMTVVGGIIETLIGLRDAWSHGAPVNGEFGGVLQQALAVLPYVLILLFASMHISKRSLITLLVAALLCSFMSSFYFELHELGMVVYVVPFIQLVFVAGALAVMFTFWLLRKRPAHT
jgi:hypothetical protein